MDVFDYECGPKCQSKQHATDLNSVITRYSLPEIQAYFQLCHSAGHLADLGGQTPLHVAVSCGKFDVVEWLVKDKKVDVNAVDTESGWTALHKAIFYGQIKIARFLIQNSAHLCSLDHDGIQPLELLLRERTTFLTFSHKDSNDVFMWGENRNSTLGHSSEQRRQIPTAVDTFRRQKLSIKKVLLRKYHTVFLTQCGQVYTCGHGQGGRLGLGNENTYLIPQRVEALKPEICIEIAASVNHTAVLTKRGNVYTFGLNNHQQLAQISQSMKCLSPKWIKSLKGQKIKHVCVSQYHSVFCTQDAVFAVGFNGGQLGFPKAEQYQVVLRSAPLLEQNLFDSKKGRLIIDLIACSDAATVCLTTSLDIFVLHEYQCRKIMPSWSTVSKIDVIGGNLDLGSEVCSSPTSSADKSSCLTTGSSQLVIMVLSRKGQVYIWRSLNSILKCCIFTTRHLYISDICLGDSSFAIVAIDGRAYTANWKNTKVIKGKVPTEEEEEGENPFIPHSKKKDIEKEGIEVYRIPFIHRASSIAINKEGNDFAVTQVTPTLRLDINYHENISHMAADFTRLMNMDLYDLQIKFGHQTWPAHQYIVAHHSNFFKKILIEASKNETTSDLVISVGYIHSDLIKQLFQFFYTDTCDLMTPGASFLWTKKEKKCIDFDYFSHPSCKDFAILAELNYFGPRSKDDDPISLLISIADKFEIRRLTNKLRKVKIHQGVVDHKGIKLDIPRVAFDHQKLPELSDLSIYSNDGSKFKCHRCVLIARSEYFTCMLTNDWLEASSSEGVKLPFSANSVEVLLEYLYTNEIPSLLEKKTLDLVCEVLVMANQILLIELKDLSEKEIISFINLRNVIDLLEFALLYDACHLKEMCLQVICHNMAYMLESRHLDVLNDEIMMELTMSYRKLIKDMSYRIVTPSSSGPDEAYLKSLVAYLQSNKQTNLKPNSGCKQKLNKRRPRVKTKSVSEDIIEPNKSPQMNDVVDESYSVLTAESIPEKQLDESPLQKINHLPKTKRDKNNPWNMLTSPVRAQDSTEKHSPENSFLVGKVVNLADIMAEQNTLSQPVNNYLQGGSRYKKLSRKSVPKTPPVLETKSVQPLNNPWIKNLKQENICPQPNLSDIVQDELQKMKDIDRIQKKPFEYIQIEEKAIEELISLYSMNISFEENITINRETLRREQPVWGRRKNLLL